MANFPPIQVPLINGVVWSFQHITCTIAGLEFTGGFKKIDYKRNRKREMVRSNNSDPIGKTQGENEYSCKVDMYLAWWFACIATVQQQLGPGYGDVSFSISVKYGNNGFAPFVDQILNCTFDSTEANNEAGVGALVRGVDFNPTKILFNGIDDLSNPLQAAAQ